jgi:hypothetical protein
MNTRVNSGQSCRWAAGRGVLAAVCAALLAGHAAAQPEAAGDAPRTRSPEKMELAAQAGLRYIVSRQKADGSFECDKYPTAVAGLSCLAILANRGNRPLPEHDRALKAGIDFILLQQSEKGMVGLNMYEHAIGTLAVLQQLGMVTPESDPKLTAFCRRSIDLTLAGQAVSKLKRNRGGWTYEAADENSDLSNTSWQLLLLYSARQCGFAIDTTPFQSALTYINLCSQKEGYGYTPPFSERSGKSHRSLTGVALFLKEILAPGSMEREPRIVRWLTEVQPSWGGTQYRGYFFCSSFYMTQGMFQIGGTLWEDYYNRLADLLLERQESDGHWPFPPDNLDEGLKAGPVYSTSMAVLMLSQEKQYLPIYQRQRAINY